jgi:hypothetical protein
MAVALLATGGGLFATSGAAMAATPTLEASPAAGVLVPQNRHFGGQRWRDRRSCDAWSVRDRWHGDRRHFDCRFVGGWWEYWTD